MYIAQIYSLIIDFDYFLERKVHGFSQLISLNFHHN
jgi:hypothetical protein